MRNLVTYWTIFSFISLFEHVFEKLIEWVPLWPYIKLIAICWLVIPEFNGACYSYQHLVHPCLPLKLHDVIAQFYVSCYVYQCFAYLCSFVNLQTFTDWFNKPMEDPDLKNETFLERYLEENGSDALVKLISNKTACEGSGPVWEDIKVMEHMAKHEVAEPKQVFACNGSTNVYFGRARGYFFLNFTGGAFVLVVEQDKEQAGTTQVL
ncbi:HVA22-like protein c isoform X3 [Nicotiana tabacum]